MQTTKQPAKLGWDPVEAQEMSRAMKQPLMVQTPLQVLLETLFNRIQAQASYFGEMQKRIERIEVRDMDGEEMMSRLRLCEKALADIHHEKLSPFNQQDVLNRLGQLESQMATLTSMPAPTTSNTDSKPPTPLTSPRQHYASPSIPSAMASPRQGAAGGPAQMPLDARLTALETKLAGIYNLSGKLMAMEHIAQELDIEIPDMEYEPGTNLNGGQDAGQVDNTATPFKAAAGMGGTRTATAGAAQQPQGLKQQEQSRGGSAGDTLSSTSPADNGNADAEANDGNSIWPGMGALTSRTPSMFKANSAPGMRLADVLSQVEGLKEESAELRSKLEELRKDVDNLGTKHTEVLEEQDAVSLRVAAVEAASVEMRENLMAEVASVQLQLKQPPEVCFADFSALKSRVETAATSVETATAAIESIKTSSVPVLQQQVDDLKDQFKKAHEARDMDTLFHNRISKLEATVGDVRGEVQLAIQDVMSDVARISDLSALEDAIDRCATASDVKLLAAQHAHLAQSVSGMADLMATRPDTGEGTRNGGGFGATKFKCLTCNQEIKPQTTLRDTARAKGAFLPKLESMLAEVGAPLGPGINASELRQIAEDRTKGRKGSPPRTVDLEEYGKGGDLVGTGGGGRVRSGGRTALPMPTGTSLLPRNQQGLHRTPVFI